MKALWQVFFDICCFRKGPQHLPASSEFLSLTLFIYGICSFLLALSTQSIGVAAFSGIVDAILIAILCYLLLLLFRKSERWLQTTTALTGTGVLFSIVTVPLSFIITSASKNNPLVSLSFVFVIFLLVWNIGVMAHIMRNALSSSLATGVLAALFYIWVITVVIAALFPQVA